MIPRLNVHGVAMGLTLLFLPGGAVATDVCVGGGLGVGYLPMTDWQNFLTHLDSSPVGWYGEVEVKMKLAHRHSLGFSVERISKSAVLESTPASSVRVEYDFMTIPMNLTYQFSFGGWGVTSPLLGIGIGVYRSEVRYFSSGGSLPPSRGERDGWGYGVHGIFGYRVAVTQTLATLVKLRGRWADGMYFTDDTSSVDVDFTGVDVTGGIELHF